MPDSTDPQKPHAERIASETIRDGHKTIFVDLKTNHRGLHFRITEETNGKRSAIVVPIDSAAEVAGALVRLGVIAAEIEEGK